MHVQVNGETRELQAGTTLADLVADLAPDGQRFAVEVNEQLVPRSLHRDRLLVEGNVTYDDIDRVAVPALNHRLVLNFAAHAENIDPRKIIEGLVHGAKRTRR